jgi:LmbE family N-acetylglucosaminyl deacetylase
MLPLSIGNPRDRSLSVLAIGAHPDDIEIGAGGTLLTLAEAQPGLQVRYVVLTGTTDRQLEARTAAQHFLPAADVAVDLHQLPDGRLPAVWGEVKETLEDLARACTPDLLRRCPPGSPSYRGVAAHGLS